jgi:hypothetical protein
MIDELVASMEFRAAGPFRKIGCAYIGPVALPSGEIVPFQMIFPTRDRRVARRVARRLQTRFYRHTDGQYYFGAREAR